MPCRSTGAWTSARRSQQRRSRCRRPPLSRPRRPERRDGGHRVPPRLRRGMLRSRPAAGAGHCSSPAPACISQRRSTGWSSPASGRTSGRHRGGARHRRPLRSAEEPRPRGRRQDRPRQPPAHRAGPGGVDRQRSAVQLVRPGCRCVSADGRRAVRNSLASCRPGRADRATCPRDDGAGLLDEVAHLAAHGLSPTARQALGYKELLDHLDGLVSLDEAVGAIVTRTRRFATRQERWFRRDPRIRWIDIDPAAADPLAEVRASVIDCPRR